MNGVNKHILIGHVGRDPEIKQGAGGAKLATFSLATSESWKDKTTGERKESTAWHRIVVYNEKIAEIVERYVKKGSKVYIEGQVLTRSYKDRAGADRSITETVLKSFGGALTLLDKADRAPDAGDEGSYSKSQLPPLDDEVPF